MGHENAELVKRQREVLPCLAKAGWHVFDLLAIRQKGTVLNFRHIVKEPKVGRLLQATFRCTTSIAVEIISLSKNTVVKSGSKNAFAEA